MVKETDMYAVEQHWTVWPPVQPWFEVYQPWVIALPVGIYSAIRQDTAADYLGRSLAIIGLATPNFWLGLMVVLYPAIWWGWTPPLKMIPLMEDPLRNLAVFIVPSLILGTAMSAATMLRAHMRMTRTMMLEVLRQDPGGAGAATDNSGPKDIRRYRWLEI